MISADEVERLQALPESWAISTISQDSLVVPREKDQGAEAGGCTGFGEDYSIPTHP